MYRYNFFIQWRNEDTASSILVGNYAIKDNALFLYTAAEDRYGEIQQTISYMVIPFSSIKYFTYEYRG